MMSKSVGLLLIFSIKYFIKHKENRFYRMLRRGRTNENFFDYAWVHLSCALWNRDVKFGNYELKGNINVNEQNIYAKYDNINISYNRTEILRYFSDEGLCAHILTELQNYSIIGISAFRCRNHPFTQEECSHEN